MPILQQGKSQFFVTIPKDLIQAKKWKKGQKLLLIFNERGNIEMREIEENL
jgi:hypothetical protein